MFTTEAVNRFWSLVNTSGDCWIWQGGTLHGYGRYQANGRRYGAHRFAYLLEHGELPTGMQVCHGCDTPLCVKPEHLFSGTPRDNAVDMQRKGRKASQKGSQNGRAKLTDENVLDIRNFRKKGVPVQVLAERFGVAKSNISMAATGKSWIDLH